MEYYLILVLVLVLKSFEKNSVCTFHRLALRLFFTLVQLDGVLFNLSDSFSNRMLCVCSTLRFLDPYWFAGW